MQDDRIAIQYRGGSEEKQDSQPQSHGATRGEGMSFVGHFYGWESCI